MRTNRRPTSATPPAWSTAGARYDVFIGRPSKWGNPFVIGRDGDRAMVIAKYEAWVRDQPALRAALVELCGKVLGCYCAPLPCHGDVLARLAEEGRPGCEPR